MSELIDRLKAASAGHTATYGDAVPNLFADALAEIVHLRKLEDAARIVNSNFPTKDQTAHWTARPDSLEEQVKARLDATGRMVGLIRAWGGTP